MRARTLTVAIIVAILAAVVATAVVATAPGAAPGEPGPRPFFRDATVESGLAFRHENGARGRRYLPETMGAGGCALDADGDGWTDVYLVQSGPWPDDPSPPLSDRLFRNRGRDAAGCVAFEDVTDRAGIGDPSYGQGAVCGDLDGDGDDDVVTTGFGRDLVRRNRGDGTFEPATVLGAPGGWSSSAALFDAEGDGDLDLYVVRYLAMTLAGHRDCRHQASGLLVYCHPDVYPPAPDVFYRNRGDGTFEDATAAAGLGEATGKGLGVVVLDFDDDGDRDLYVANDSTPNFLWRNRGDGSFEEVGVELGVSHNADGVSEAGMGVDAGDVDGDSRVDLVVTNLSLETNALYLGGPLSFTHATRRAGLHGPSYLVNGFGVDLLDVDADGDLDLVVVNGDVLDNVEQLNDAVTFRQPGQVFSNDGRGRFRELTAAEAGDLATPRVGRGSITLDADADGRLDLVVTYNGDEARFYRNEAPAAGWLVVAPRRGSSAAIGARVIVEAAGRRRLAEVGAGSSYLTSSEPRLHYGLGLDGSLGSRVDRVDVRWPDGRRRALVALPAGRIVVVPQGR